MTNTCGQPHPEHPTAACDMTVPTDRHSLCTAWIEELGEYRDWPNPSYDPPKRITKDEGKAKMAEMAARVQPATSVLGKPAEGFPAALEGSERASGRWTEEEKALVDAAIEQVARAHAGGGEFTAEAIWQVLDTRVPVTKGLTSRLAMADRRGLICSTGKTEIAKRGGKHDHAQRLTVWCSLINKV